MATRHVVDQAAEFPQGTTRVIEVNGRSIGVMNVGGDFYAMRNVCPHHGAPLCVGPTGGSMLPTQPHAYQFSGAEEDRIVRCPWHGYEFRLHNGESVTDPDGMRVKTYEVKVEDGEVVVYA